MIKRDAKCDFNDFRFGGLTYYNWSNKYLRVERVDKEETKIVVRIGDEHLQKTQYGYALILDCKHVVFVKDWQVNQNFYGSEVLLDKNYFNVKEWGSFDEFDVNEENLDFNTWLQTAKEQMQVIGVASWAK